MVMRSDALTIDTNWPTRGLLPSLAVVRRRAGKAKMSAPDFKSAGYSKDLDMRMAACVVAVAANADREAFRTVFDYYAPRVKGFLMRSGGDAARAEELAQETLATVWRKAALFDPQKASVSTWIFTIARNLRIDAFRREKHPEIDPNDPAILISAPLDPDESLAGVQDAEQLARAMADLSESERQLLAMAYYEDKSQSKIAAELKLPLGTVKSRMRQIFVKLRARLEDDAVSIKS